MKRTAVILFCTVSLWNFASAQVLSRINGELRYQYQYQDYISAGAHAITSTQSPMLRLVGSGVLFDPSIISYDLQSIIFLTSSNARVSQQTASSKSVSWDYYNATFAILPEFPVTTSLQLVDGFTQSSLTSPQFDVGGRRLRRQQQNLMFTTHQIPFLPSIRFSIFHTHQWAPAADKPVDESSTNYSLNLSSGSKEGSVSVSGSLSESSERYSGSRTRYYSLFVNGTRNFVGQQYFSYNINYYRYADAMSINGIASYLNSTSKELHFATTLNSQNNSGQSYQTNLTSLSQSVQYVPNDNFRYSLGLGGSFGKNESSPDSSSNYTTNGGNASFSMQHSRRYGNVGFSNGISIGYGVTKYLNRQATFSTGFSNTVSMPLSTYQLSAGHSFTYGHLKNGQRRSWVNNNANLDISGTTIYNFQAQVNTSYESDVNSGDLLPGFGNSQEIRLQWLFNSPTFYYDRLQFTVGLGGGENWFITNGTNRISVWSANFSCSQSYIRNLTFAYYFNRTFDRITRRIYITHAVEMHYQWRAITMDLRYDNYRVTDSRHNLWLTISRPF